MQTHRLRVTHQSVTINVLLPPLLCGYSIINCRLSFTEQLNGQDVFLGELIVSFDSDSVRRTHVFNLEQVLVRTNHCLGLHPVCNLLTCAGLVMMTVSGQQSTELLTLQVANDGLNLSSATD
jgi:hypothetical protein